MKLKQDKTLIKRKAIKKDAIMFLCGHTRAWKRMPIHQTSSIANFLELLYFEKNDYENSNKFKDIVRNPPLKTILHIMRYF
jgi:hypothetical protein